jgi:antitoxin component of MazEF toxin-antitoxin module
VAMKLQKQVSRRIEETEYAKYVVVIPPDRVERLGWKEGQELDSQIQGQKLVLFPRANDKEKRDQK